MNDRYGWDDRHDRDPYRRYSGEGRQRSLSAQEFSRVQDNSADRWRSDTDDWSSRGQSDDGRHHGRSDFDREQRFGGSARDERVGGYGGGAYGQDHQAARYGAHQTEASQRGQDDGRYSSSGYGYGYGAGQQGGRSSQQPYFTGQQHAWQVPSSYGADNGFSGGAAPGYGTDYREHGYAGRQHERGFLQRAGDEVASWFGDDDAARRREADHRGRGPADYTRSDERIREDANDRLTEDWRVDASRISVAVEAGEITLSGTVTRREDKRRAEDIVEELSGVKHVQNNLRVEQQTAWSGASGTSASAGTGTGSATSFGSSSTGAATTAGKSKLEPPQT